MYSPVHPCTSVACVLKWFQTYSKLLRRFVWNVYVWRILHVVDVMKISYNQYLIYQISKYISRFSNYSEQPPHTFAKTHDTRAFSLLRNKFCSYVWGLYSSHLENKKICCLHASMTHQLFFSQWFWIVRRFIYNLYIDNLLVKYYVI